MGKERTKKIIKIKWCVIFADSFIDRINLIIKFIYKYTDENNFLI